MIEEYQNNRRNRLLPIFFALVLSIGFIGGYQLNQRQKMPKEIYIQSDKIKELQYLIKNYYFDSVNNLQLTDNAIRAMLSDLDPHSSYMTKIETQQFETSMSGGIEGIGIQFNILNDTVTVMSITNDGPAEKVGVLPGDKIIEVDTSKIAGVKIQNNDVIQKIRGKKGSKVKIGILRNNNDKLLYFNIKRDAIAVNSIDYYYMIKPTIGYININSFTQTTADEFSLALNKLLKLGAKNLILDLRGNTGGFLAAAVSICDELLPAKKMIVYTKGLHYRTQEIRASNKGNFQNENQHLVILIDEYSASASEIVAGAIQDHDRGTIIGRRSFGKGLVQQQFVLSDSSEVLLTIARYYTPVGRCIQRPFDAGNEEKYMNDFYKRYLDGEMEEEDKNTFDDSLKFTTPSGKIVYGGGGIMPDIFIPLKTSEDIIFFNRLANSGIVFQYAAQYATNNRKKMLKQYPSAKDYINNFSISEDIIAQIQEKAKQDSIVGILTEVSKKELCKWTKAYIGRNIYGNDAFYPIIHQDDDMIKSAFAVFK